MSEKKVAIFSLKQHTVHDSFEGQVFLTVLLPHVTRLLHADATNPFGSGCPKGEGCCKETNTCVKISSCADFTRACPPTTCGKDLSFGEVTVSCSCSCVM